MNLESRIAELGLKLPLVVKPAASYLPAVRTGNLVFVSGQLPMLEGKLLMTGPMTPERSMEEAIRAMEQCFLNGLGALGSVADLNRPIRVVRLGAFVASTPEFTNQHLVANGASDLAIKIFGEEGRHARAAVGMSVLPLDATVELEILFELSDV